MESSSPVYHAKMNSPLIDKIKELISFNGKDPESFDSDLVTQIIYSSLKMLNGEYNTGQIKLMTRAFKEMQYAYSIFNKYKNGQRISIFGSARTPETHPDYISAKAFGSLMASKGWVCITGGADGIMRAGLEGAEVNSSFGLSIRLPFETPSNSLMAGDPKLISFRYFFTRKLIFLSHSDAIAAFPGGVGTQDELFEALTLMQTGKANIIPVILIEGEGGSYWKSWYEYIEKSLLQNGWISAEDLNLFYVAPSVELAGEHVQRFYRRYHSSRYVKDVLVIRLKKAVNEDQVKQLNEEFRSILVQNGVIYATNAIVPEETDHLDLPRIAFEHNRQHFGTLRVLIDRLNSYE